ncbi:hypothetical protein Taro_023721 [Colocasia esculenta]|uniref:SMC hinge domain-containing protein n=1 Tax=Colocasia esculenta TaxID=4460 RepID=A0A843V5F4_COLES|nr:hypothetical protein [Colocasia esculenta]
MLFVFGKRAKQMRLNKVSELIHNSTNHQNLDSAGVSVHFQEIIDLVDGSYKAVPGSDFVITRVAFRDNSSKYYINDRASNFTEVTKKLKGKGVDLDNNRFLILQNVKNEAESYMLKELTLLKWQEKATKLASEDAISHISELQEDELDNDLRNCKDQFKEFERQDVKYREDLKHLKQKIKKVEEKLQKDSYKTEELQKESEESTNVIPKLEEEIPKLQQFLLDEEKTLEEIKEDAKDGVYDLQTPTVAAGRASPAAKSTPPPLKAEHNPPASDLRSEGSLLGEFASGFAWCRRFRADTRRYRFRIQRIKKVKVGRALHGAMPAKMQLTTTWSWGMGKLVLFFTEISMIAAKYDVAISTACPGLDYIVVETTVAAQACVELLRKKNLGIATFMILEGGKRPKGREGGRISEERGGGREKSRSPPEEGEGEGEQGHTLLSRRLNHFFFFFFAFNTLKRYIHGMQSREIFARSRENISLGPFPRNKKAEMPLQILHVNKEVPLI